ncbi:MAG: hypothetical protein HC794_00825 [Nitrospiraceae bacterium]|nr:hypothetical protein [Nitrospiraceae bacterium]
MKSTEFWLWTVIDECTGKRVRSSWRMTEEQAKDYPGAERVPGSSEVRLLPETVAETQRQCTSHLMRRDPE